ncbi:alpha/beta hydrolase [Rhizobiaceae bacterium n13]|uniref:Alpha/beta hydrolase n=1 Tax=Ferirhizobium litorale TaxID=2927786 RepID=A0AAE3U323_9HYPH|nr:alpha/beta hydrolase [Fererhizobium litorale]MDI7863724.1 alpha/beta hydrolase [Fererhizobium litorale]MDI7924176.1 alpha/beta hydrolase [Fererhizobium litorale]
MSQLQEALSRPMPSEEGILTFLDRCDQFYPADAVNATIAEQRRFYDALCAEFSPPLPEGLTNKDDLIEGRVPVRRYRPADVRTETVLLYIHGGGFVVGSLESHDAICAEIADRVGAELVAVDYRLAPEHVWPAQTEDCRDVLLSLLADGRKVVLVGDSAGGNLAAGLTLQARDEGWQGVAGQALIYPALGGDLVSGSYVDMAEAPGLSTVDVAYYRSVLKAPEDDRIAFPLLEDDFRGLPPTFITVAHFDPLRDDGRKYAARLLEAGIDVWFREEPQMVHAWLRARSMSDGARDGFSALCVALSRLAGTL